MSLLTQFYNCDGGGGGGGGGLGTGAEGLYGFGPLSGGAVDGAYIGPYPPTGNVTSIGPGAAGFTDYYYSPPRYPGMSLTSGGTLSIPQAGSTIHGLTLSAGGAAAGTFVYLNNSLGIAPGRANTTFKGLSLSISAVLSGNVEYYVCAASIEDFTCLMPPANLTKNVRYDFNLSTLSSAQVDAILIALAAEVAFSTVSCSVSIAGGNAAPGPAGLAAKATIAATGGWTCTTN